MQAEIGLAIILIIVLLADLFQKVPSPKNMQRLSCALLVILLLNNVFNSASGEAFGSMYINTPMTSVVKTVLTLGTILVFMQADTWLEREDTRHKAGEFYLLTLSTLLGMFYMVSAGSFLLFYVGLELASIPMACLYCIRQISSPQCRSWSKIHSECHVLVRFDALRFIISIRNLWNNVFQ